MKLTKKATPLDLRIAMLGDLNDRYRSIVEMPEPDLEELRKLALAYQEHRMPERARCIFVEIAILERSRKSVPIRGIIDPNNSTGYGGTNENPPVCQIDIGIPVGARTDSLLTTAS